MKHLQSELLFLRISDQEIIVFIAIIIVELEGFMSASNEEFTAFEDQAMNVKL